MIPGTVIGSMFFLLIQNKMNKVPNLPRAMISLTARSWATRWSLSSSTEGKKSILL